MFCCGGHGCIFLLDLDQLFKCLWSKQVNDINYLNNNYISASKWTKTAPYTYCTRLNYNKIMHFLIMIDPTESVSNTSSISWQRIRRYQLSSITNRVTIITLPLPHTPSQLSGPWIRFIFADASRKYVTRIILLTGIHVEEMHLSIL